MKWRLLLVLAALVFGVPLFSSSCEAIPAGHRGVLFRPFGGRVEMGRTYGEGFHWVAPWNTLVAYDSRLQEQEEATV